MRLVASFRCAGARKGSAHRLPFGLGAPSALRCLGADQVALYVGKPGQYANIKAPGAGAGVGPPFAECRDHEIATGSITTNVAAAAPVRLIPGYLTAARSR